VTFFTHFSPNT